MNDIGQAGAAPRPPPSPAPTAASTSRSKSNMTAIRDTPHHPSLPAAFATKTCAASATKPPANAVVPSASIASLLCPTQHPLGSDCANPCLLYTSDAAD